MYLRLSHIHSECYLYCNFSLEKFKVIPTDCDKASEGLWSQNTQNTHVNMSNLAERQEEHCSDGLD